MTHTTPLCCKDWCSGHSDHYSPKNQQNNEEWEKEFDKWFGHGKKGSLRFAYASGVYTEVKEFIRQQRQIDIEDIKKQAVKEFAEELKRTGSALAITGDGKCYYSREMHTKGDLFISVESIDQALEVYEGK